MTDNSMAHANDISYETGVKAVELAREAMDTYVKNQRKIQLGSRDDIFYQRAGLLVQLQSANGMTGIRGSAANYTEDTQFGEVLIDTVVRAASDRSGKNAVSRGILDSTRISLAIVTETRLGNSVDDFNLSGDDIYCPIIKSRDEGSTWVYPGLALQHDWTMSEYLDRTFRVANRNANEWRVENNNIIVLKVRYFEEESPRGSVVEKTPATMDSEENKQGIW